MSVITVETLLSDVKRLVIRLQRHDTAADSLIDQAKALKEKTESQATFPADPEDTDFSAADSNEEGERASQQWELPAHNDNDNNDDGANSQGWSGVFARVYDVYMGYLSIFPFPFPGAFPLHIIHLYPFSSLAVPLEVRIPYPSAADPSLATSSVASAFQQPENRNITKLQRENKELRLLLEEHQIALDMIMTKYRERMSELIAATTAPRLRANAAAVERLQGKTERLAAGMDLMHESTRKDDAEEWAEIETIARLESENRGLRDLLAMSSKLGSGDDDDEQDDDEGADGAEEAAGCVADAAAADVTCISRQLSDEEGLNSSDQSQAGAPGGTDSYDF